MIDIVLSELDFDYEIQALVASFFPGQRCRVAVEEGYAFETEKILQEFLKRTDCDFLVGICFGKKDIAVSLLSMKDSGIRQQTVTVSGEGDWHKHKDKSAHPYRTYYKNECKRLLFESLRDLPEQFLPDGVVKRIPAWGTMTGVRPTKIPMHELMQGRSREETAELLERWYCCEREKKELCLDIAMREANLLQTVDFENGYSLYIGIPFCPTTCLYCSFPSYPFGQFGHLAGRYLEALKKEMAAVAEQCRDHPLTSIYMGGGTPTALTASQLDELLFCLYELFSVSRSLEFTVEAGRPDSITREKLKVLRKYGVERISVNPQTMQQRTLEVIGRQHTVEDVKRAFLQARKAGFTNINMDFIIGLPGETPEDFEDTLRQAGELAPDSITVHSLVVKRASKLRSLLEEGGNFLEQERIIEGKMEKMLALSQQFAKSRGYLPYYMYRQKNSAGHFGSSGQENIGYAKKGSECLYNILIMEEMQTIVAVGAGASTKKYHKEKKIVSRIENVKSITDYIDRIDEMIARKKGIWS